ncbi:MAG: GNAT family N-acetyltransferase [Novosphingobium sp.]
MVEADLALLRTWREQPHWTLWWGRPVGDEMAEALADSLLSMWLIEFEGRAFAYAQDYDPHDLPGHHFGYLPVGSRAIDQSIGDLAMVGHGHGSVFLGLYVEQLFAAGAPVIGADPHPTNARAIRAYQRAGFAVVGSAFTPWGHKVLMECRRGQPVRPPTAAQERA